jgi:hypothetical protein
MFLIIVTVVVSTGVVVVTGAVGAFGFVLYTARRFTPEAS